MSNAAALSVGYDVEFLDENVSTQSLACSICLLVLREPMQAVPCGHRFCKKCIELVKETEETENVLCPIDQTTIQDHLGECPFQIIKCEKKCGQAKILRKEMVQHLEESCPNTYIGCPCSCFGCQFKMVQHLEESCPNTYIGCPCSCFGCQFKGTGETLESHMKDSLVNHLHLQVEDQNTRLSHLEEDQVSEKIANEKLKKLLETSTVDIEQFQNNIRGLKTELLAHQQRKIEQNDDLKANIHSLSKFFSPKCPFVVTIKNVSLEINKPEKTDYVSTTFKFLNGYQGRLRVIFNDKYIIDGKKYLSGRSNKFQSNLRESMFAPMLEKFIGVYLHIAQGPYDDVLEWPMLFGEVSYKCIVNGECMAAAKLKCKDNEEILKKIFAKPGFETEPKSRWGIPNFIAQSNIPDFINDDEIRFAIDIRY